MTLSANTKRISGSKAQGIAHSLFAQIVFVWVAFALMAFSSYRFMSRIERAHMIRDAQDTLSFTQANIAADLLEPETTLGSISQTLHYMINRGDSAEMIHGYLRELFEQVFTDGRHIADFSSAYGVFDVFGGVFLDAGNRPVPDGYVPTERPWYKDAVKANGGIIVTQPYPDIVTGITVITIARQIVDNAGTQLGVMALDINIDETRKRVAGTRTTKNGYGVLLNSQLEVIAHPDSEMLGLSLYDIDSGMSALADELRQGIDVSEREVKNYHQQNCIVFFRQIGNGWYLGIVTPVNDYYRPIRTMGLFLGSLGFAMALALSIILWRIAVEKNSMLNEMRRIEIAEESNKAKSKFLATMSHEIRTPMNAILGITEIQMQNRELSQTTHEALGKIYNSASLLLHIINDILDLSKIEAGKMELMPVQYDIASIINDTIQLNMAKLDNEYIQFKLNIDPAIPLELVGDELRIKQILNNLLSNAFKYTEKGEVVLSVTAEPDSGTDSGVTLIFDVRDTGQGMSEKQVDALFGEYSRFNLESNRMITGAGLGLNITKRLVTMMNGTISVKSRTACGTTFTVRLPQKQAGSDVLGREAAEKLQQFRFNVDSYLHPKQVVREPMPYGSVLIVDDVETNLYVAQGLFAPYGLAIDLVASGSQAIDKIKSGKVYDIVFMDHMMPVMDGIEATKIIRELGYKGSIVALTANAIVGQAEMFMENGFDGFVSKPIDIRQLNVTLNQLIRDKQPPEVLEAARKGGLPSPSAPDLTLPPEPVVEDLAFLREKLLAFEQACAEKDQPAAKSLLVELNRKKWTPQTKHTLNTLTEHLFQGEFDRALDIAEELAHRPGGIYTG